MQGDAFDALAKALTEDDQQRGLVAIVGVLAAFHSELARIADAIEAQAMQPVSAARVENGANDGR